MARLHPTSAGALLALALLVTACGKQPEPESAKFPAGNEAQTRAMSAAECDRLPDPAPVDDSAAGKAKAVSDGMAAREACRKSVLARENPDEANSDLRRIREIKEREEADRLAAKKSDKEFFKGVAEGGKQPIREFKY